MQKLPSLSPRLQKIADLVPCCKTLADIGTDHAYIPVHLVHRGRTERAIASDIKAGPLARAAENVGRFGLEEQIELRLGAGLETVCPGEADVIVIAGMGGILIADILKKSHETVSRAKLLILQPMTAAYELREFLCENGFEIRGEYLAAEDDKLYCIITAAPHGKTDYSEAELFLGRGIGKNSPELWERYRAQTAEKLNKRIHGLESAAEKDTAAIDELKNALNLIESKL